MYFIEAAIFILFFAIISVPIAARFRIPLEIFLVIGSGLISFFPGVPILQINPLIIFNLFLPPILFYAAFFTSWRYFKTNVRQISLLAVALVVCTAVIIAVVTRFMIPGFSWAECFLLGAIVSPTDATSATSIIKKLNAPKKLIDIIEGESLINDATALIIFRFSLAAILIGSFSMTKAITEFFIMSTGGVIVGLIIGYISTYILKKTDSVPAEISLTFVTCFMCYTIAEHVSFSGVIATVTCGIYFGITIPEIISFSQSQMRIHGKATWNTAMFIINGFVFTLIGLEIPFILKNLETHSIVQIILYGIIISILLIVIRIGWVFSISYLTRFFSPSISHKKIIHWPTLFILGWSGMRGIVSLAAVLSLPYQLTVGVPFPHRDLLIFITYIVIFVTLIIPTITLPFLIRYLRLTDIEDRLKLEALARLRVLENVMKNIDEIIKNKEFPEKVTSEFRNQIERRVEVIKAQLNKKAYSTLSVEYMALRKLMQITFEVERNILIKLRREGEINDDIFHLLTDELDIEEVRTRTLRI